MPRSRQTVLFACVHNAGRSQIAAALFNRLADSEKAHAVSAGTSPADRPHPEVVASLEELDIDLSRARPQRLTDELAAAADLLITMGCGEACPVVPGLETRDWELPDPKGRPAEEVRAIRERIRERVQALVEEKGWSKASRSAGFGTRAIHAGETRDPATNAHNTPIYQTATFSFERAEDMAAAIAEPFDHFFYTRTGNPTAAALETKLAVLEGSEDALAAASGMAAVAIAVLSSAKAGDHVLVGEDLFVISRQFFGEECPDLGIEVSFVDTTNLDAVRAAIRPNTTVLFTESVSNPHMLVADLPALAALSREHGLTFIVDNTFLSPFLLRPMEHGADLVLHAATKYLSGHGDTIAGALAGSRTRLRRARLKLDALGQCLSPLSAWLVLRGARTLPLRMRRHCDNAAALASHLEAHPRVEWVRYPGLESHPQHETVSRLLTEGFGGMLAFKVAGGAEAMNRFANALELCDLGVSLGDLFTLVYPQPRRDNLIRVSVGCEDAADVIADFDQALARD